MRVDVPMFLKRRAKLSSSNSELRIETFLELPMKLLKHSASWDIVPRSTSPNPTNSTWKPQYSVYPFQFQVEAWKKHFCDLKVIQSNLPFWLTFSVFFSAPFQKKRSQRITRGKLSSIAVMIYSESCKRGPNLFSVFECLDFFLGGQVTCTTSSVVLGDDRSTNSFNFFVLLLSASRPS